MLWGAFVVEYPPRSKVLRSAEADEGKLRGEGLRKERPPEAVQLTSMNKYTGVVKGFFCKSLGLAATERLGVA